jgi:single-strand DNA-binding protein
MIVTGRLTADPKRRQLDSGSSVCNFRIAVNEQWGEGGANERTTFLSVDAWDKLGETCSQHLGKGRKVLVQGRFVLREWQDNEGATRVSPEIRANQVMFLDWPKDSNGSQRGGFGAAKGTNQGGFGGEQPPPPDDEDIPF